MQKWEYGRLFRRPSALGPPREPLDAAGFQWDFETQNGLEHGDKATFLEVVNRLGAEGWELVSTTSNGRFYFKRPKQ